jgi:hypothetical protein
MLPDFLVDTYKQYKADTDAIASWLAKTAIQCGYSADLLPPPEPPKTKPSAAPNIVLTRKQRLRQEERERKGKKSSNPVSYTSSTVIISFDPFPS